MGYLRRSPGGGGAHQHRGQLRQRRLRRPPGGRRAGPHRPSPGGGLGPHQLPGHVGRGGFGLRSGRHGRHLPGGDRRLAGAGDRRRLPAGRGHLHRRALPLRVSGAGGGGGLRLLRAGRDGGLALRARRHRPAPSLAPGHPRGHAGRFDPGGQQRPGRGHRPRRREGHPGSTAGPAGRPVALRRPGVRRVPGSGRRGRPRLGAPGDAAGPPRPPLGRLHRRVHLPRENRPGADPGPAGDRPAHPARRGLDGGGRRPRGGRPGPGR